MLGIKELCQRYNLASTKSFYRRLGGLRKAGLEAELHRQDGKSYAPMELVSLLDDLDSHIKNGGTTKNYCLPSKTTVLDEQENITVSSARHTATRHDDTTHQSDTTDVADLAIAVLKAMQPLLPVADPFAHIDRLQALARDKIEITTKEAESLIGIKPSGKVYNRGSFSFVKVGRIGANAAWRVFFRERKID